jgi:DinB superfamily
VAESAYEYDILLPLTQMTNFLSKRITPQRDETKLTRPAERGEWSVREIVAHLRDNEALYFPKLYLLVTREWPNLTGAEEVEHVEYDPRDLTLTVMSQFRRLRQSTLSLLRELPDDAWRKAGYLEGGVTVTVRDLATDLVIHDAEHLQQIDATLIARGALPPAVRPLVRT